MHPDPARDAGTGHLAAWQREVGLRLAAVKAGRRQDGPFEASLTGVPLGYVRLLSLEADPVRLSRTPGLVESAPALAVAVVLQEHGHAALTQDGRSTVLEPGQAAVVDLRRPFSLDERERFRLRVLRVPDHALDVPAHSVRRVTGRALSPRDGVPALLVPLLARLAVTAGRIPPSVADALGGNTTDLLATLVHDASDPDDDDHAGAARDRLVRSVLRHIDRHLGDPDLGPESIAAAHRISVRYLHRLFEDEAVTVSRLVQRRRVEECAKELARRGSVSATVSAVSSRWGFHSPAHFSRAFKALYGHPPGRWRGAAPATTGTVRP
ncbi:MULTISPECIES: helix-turn-helix domain-containing protein [Streptomyces]|uniref:helix-turn-helix domain-containing protein n=1 Tax=Streptomyces TaxID=1883 RepID=UPI00106EDE3B|nr:helix-turn-helix domain-containing protein [Streptomyces sp. S501]QBR05353.1 helix-turn-helix domain-containing protein [Streptomyces sp. S501]